jgi:AraC-like DNA-binding protein
MYVPTYHYSEYAPDARLAPWVKNYWIANDFTDNGKISKLYPDGCMNVMFTYNNRKGTVCSNIFGTITAYMEFDGSDPFVQMFGICFKPAGIAAFTRIPIQEFTNREFELSLVETLFSPAFVEELAEKHTAEQLVLHTNSFLFNTLQHLHKIDKRIIHAVNLLRHTKGQLALDRLASDVCLCQRHFERMFKSTIGITPKMLAKIFRFEYASEYIQKNPRKDLLIIAIECGYYDCSHLTKDFKLMSGDAPTEFRM